MKRIAIAIIGAALLASCNKAEQAQQPAPQYLKVHTIKQLMATVVQPQADVFWRSAGAVVDAAGEHDLTPHTDEGWLRTRSAAATVAEMGNLLQTPLYAEGRGEDWMKFSKALVEIGRRAEKAAVDKEQRCDLRCRRHNV